jgi:hypothetical protein
MAPVMWIISSGAAGQTQNRMARASFVDEADTRSMSCVRRRRSREARGRGGWRFGGLVVVLAYSIVVWGALIVGVPKMVAWIGDRTAAANQRTASP